MNNGKFIKITASLQYNIHPCHIYHMVLKLFITQFHLRWFWSLLTFKIDTKNVHIICVCGYAQPCVPLVENTCKSCGDMTDRLYGVYNLETRMQDCRKPIPLMADFRLWEIIHAMHQAQAVYNRGPIPSEPCHGQCDLLKELCMCGHNTETPICHPVLLSW